MFHLLSSKVMDLAFEKIKPIIESLVPQCQTDPAWTNPNSNKYKQCTKWISQSNVLILNNLDHIENVVVHNLDTTVPFDVQIGQSMEGSNSLDSEGIDKALKFIEQTADSYENKSKCGKCIIRFIEIAFIYHKSLSDSISVIEKKGRSPQFWSQFIRYI